MILRNFYINKYGAKKCIVDSITFHSKLEASFYRLIKKWCIKNGLDFKLQERINLDCCVYVTDFTIMKKGIVLFRIDSKGIETSTFKIKKKLYNSSNENCIPLHVLKNTTDLKKLLNSFIGM